MDGNSKPAVLQKKVTAFFRGRKHQAVLFLGIAGMLMILLSSVLPKKQSGPMQSGGELDTQVYIGQLEDRLTRLIGKIEGVGRCEVMITAANGVEYIYAIEESQNSNETNSYEGDEMKKQTQQQNTEQKYIVMDAGSGKKEALLKTWKQPAIQGVVVVCEGAKSVVVQERVTQAVTTALGIPYNKVCVTKIS